MTNLIKQDVISNGVNELYLQFTNIEPLRQIWDLSVLNDNIHEVIVKVNELYLYTGSQYNNLITEFREELKNKVIKSNKDLHFAFNSDDSKCFDIYNDICLIVSKLVRLNIFDALCICRELETIHNITCYHSDVVVTIQYKGNKIGTVKIVNLNNN